MKLPQKKNLAERENREGCDSRHRFWFPCSSGASKKHTTILQMGLPVLPNPVPPQRWAPWKTGRSLNTVSFHKLCFDIYISQCRKLSQRQLGFVPIEVKVVLGWVRGKGRGGLVGQLVPKAALKSFPWPWGKGRGARDVKKNEIGSFWGKASNFHLQLR